ncbi:MAG: Uncharacterised protein [Methanobacteriota archaeon]|nr:MAG: Uncharacterised protein [Euryarchaeota archaeon]
MIPSQLDFEPNSDCCEILATIFTPFEIVPSIIKIPSTEIDMSEFIFIVAPSSIVNVAPALIITSSSISLMPDHFTESSIVSALFIPILLIGMILITNITTRKIASLRPCINCVRWIHEMSVAFNVDFFIEK